VAVNWKFIILAIILIGVVVNVSDIVFCMADNLIAVGVASAVSTLVALTLVGCMTPENRWRNIILVAAGVWVTDLLPTAIGTISLSFSGWMGSIVWYAILAALSGVISLLITAFIKPAAKLAVVAASPPPGGNSPFFILGRGQLGLRRLDRRWGWWRRHHEKQLVSAQDRWGDTLGRTPRLVASPNLIGERRPRMN